MIESARTVGYVELVSAVCVHLGDVDGPVAAAFESYLLAAWGEGRINVQSKIVGEIFGAVG